MRIHVAHSPDSDDAFMFYALADGLIDTEGLEYVHELQDIESLNQRAMRGELEVTAVSIHAYAYLSDRYSLLPHGASMGDRYGPRLVSRTPGTREDVKGKRVAIPGPLTSAYLALRLYEPDFQPVPTPFDQIEDRVADGEVDLGLLIHEGQLTFAERGLAPRRRPRRMVVFRDRTTATARRQRRAQGPRSRADAEDLQAPSRQHCVRIGA